MKTSYIGRMAEAATAELLQNRGYEIIVKNWRSKICEIDIVAKKDNVIFFVEVKYRSQDTQGDGFEYITTSKLKQMNFAAEVWVITHKWEGDYRLIAASVDGAEFENIEFIEL